MRRLLKTYNFKSFAKLNLSLYVGPPNNEGLHPLSSIFQQVSLYDEIIIRLARNSHKVSFIGEDVPNENTCTKVIELMGNRLNNYWDIQINKQIPSGAGLGGGSSNAAALIMALNQLERLDLSIFEMEFIAKQVGSDVPFFLYGGQRKVFGVGDCIEPVKQMIDCLYYVLILSGIHCSTKAVYSKLDKMGEFDDLSIASDVDLNLIGYNRLLKPALALSLDLTVLYNQILQHISGDVFMSGSGSTLVVPCGSLEDQSQMVTLLSSKLDPNYKCLCVNAI